MAIAGKPANATNRCRIGSLPSFVQWLLAPLAIHQLFNELHTLEIQDRCALLLAPIKRHADLPWAREDLGIFNGRFIGDHIRTNTSVTLHNVQRIAMKIACPVKPGLVVETSYVDNQSFSLPVAEGLSHP